MSLLWKDAYRVGHDIIDTEHQALFALANTFAQAKTGAAARTTLGKLLDYASIHFAREEAVLATCHLPAETLHNHRQAHAGLRRRLNELVLRFGSRGSEHQLVQETAALLETWIFNHVIKEDIKLRAYLVREIRSKPRSGFAALAQRL